VRAHILLGLLAFGTLAFAQPIETKIAFETKKVKGLPKNIEGYELIRRSEVSGKTVDVKFVLAVTWTDRVEEYELEGLSGDEDYNEVKIVANEAELEKLGVWKVTFHNLMQWANISGDDLRLEGKRKPHKSNATLVATVGSTQKVIKQGSSASVLLLLDEKTKSVCYRGKVEDAADLLERLIVNAVDEDSYTVGTTAIGADKKNTLRFEYTLYDEESEEKAGKLAIAPCPK